MRFTIKGDELYFDNRYVTFIASSILLMDIKDYLRDIPTGITKKPTKRSKGK